MIFSTPVFLTVFLPLVLAVSWITAALCGLIASRRGTERSWGPVNAFLLAASLFFYFWGEGAGVLWLIGSVLFNAVSARILAARSGNLWRKSWLTASVAGNLALLGWFKYSGFLASSAVKLTGLPIPVPEVALPLGISFDTFQAMSYVVDVYRGEVKPARGIIGFACYVTMFPQLVAGPIVRYTDIALRLEKRSITVDDVASGFRRFLCGLAKKAVIANTVAETADSVWGVIEAGHGVPASMAWLGLICYSLQIYYDFAGYSDMAIGMGRMLGFEFKENFLHPYCSRSVREFWRRWHISLSTWFRDYLYIPLGGSRRGTLRTCLNCLAVFGLCGLWHGAGVMFLLWGLWHGMFLMLERASGMKGPNAEGSGIIRSVAGWIYTAAVFMAGWVMFRSADFGDASLMFRSLAGLADASRESRAIWLACTPKMFAVMTAGIILSFPVVPAVRKAVAARCGHDGVCAGAVYAFEWIVLTFLGLVSMLFIAGGSYNPFLYFRF